MISPPPCRLPARSAPHPAQRCAFRHCALMPKASVSEFRGGRDTDIVARRLSKEPNCVRLLWLFCLRGNPEGGENLPRSGPRTCEDGWLPTPIVGEFMAGSVNKVILVG